MACIAPPSSAPVLDLQADAGLGLADNDPVSLWGDQSGSGNNATQGTGANQPTFKATDGPGGNPCVLFDGTTDFLVLPDITSQKYTIFSVLKPADSSLHTVVCGAAGSFQVRTSNALKQAALKCNSLNIGESTTVLSTVNFQQMNVLWDGTSAIFRLAGAADGMVSNPASLTNPINRVGINGATLGEFFSGSICMIRICPNALALDQIQAIEAEILARWGV